jgi:Fur family ferric uptake transcriptional regulator
MIPDLHSRKSLIDAFSTKGLRLTSQRRVLLEIIDGSDEHLDAASLLKLARERDAAIDRATVYRTLELLKKLRLVDELDLMHLYGEKHYYEATRERDHIHLACFKCGKIKEFASPLFERLKQEIAHDAQFSISVVRMEVGGRCNTCVQNAK